jgi:hypothetical protein
MEGKSVEEMSDEVEEEVVEEEEKGMDDCSDMTHVRIRCIFMDIDACEWQGSKNRIRYRWDSVQSSKTTSGFHFTSRLFAVLIQQGWCPSLDDCNGLSGGG